MISDTKVLCFLRSLRLACIGLLLVVTTPTVQAKETYTEFVVRILAELPDGASLRPDLEKAVLQATNRYRASKGLPTLKAADAKYQKAARAHAVDLMMMKTVGHTASTGHGFQSRMRALNPGQMILAAMGENAARVRNSKMSDSERAVNLMDQWINSPPHRKGLLDRSYTSVAIGVVKSGDHIYAVQIFTGPAVKTNMTFGNNAPSE